MTSIPGGWTLSRIGDVFDSWGGMTPSKSEPRYWGGAIPWISSKDIKGSAIDGGTHYITDAAAAETRLKRTPPGAVVAVMRSGILANQFPAAIVTRESTINQDLKAFDSGDASLNKWLLMAFRAYEGEILATYRKDGTTVQSIEYERLKSFALPIPPPEERERLLAKLDDLLGRLAAARERLDRVPAILRRFRQAVLAAAVSGRLSMGAAGAAHGLSSVILEREWDQLPEWLVVTSLPDTWIRTKVGAVVQKMQYGISLKGSTNPEAGLPILRMGNIGERGLDLTELQYVSAQNPAVRKFILDRGDVLFNRTNSPELVGKAAVFDGPHKMTFASYIIRLQCNQHFVLPGFLVMWISSPWGRAWARAVRTDGVSQSNINATKLSDMPLVLPPVSEQRAIVESVGLLLAIGEGATQRCREAATISDKATQSILQQAFRGLL